MGLTMPWGKYRDHAIADVPSGYLVWAIEGSNIDEPYRTAILAELAWRLGLQLPQPPVLSFQLPPGELAPAFRDMLALGYKTLALKVHPDRGGNAETMKAVNGVRAWCRARGLL